MDLEWYAVDGAGNLGYFASGGTAPIPPISFSHLRRISDAIGSYMQTMQSVSEARVKPDALARVRPSQISKDPMFYLEPWVQLASRGIYAYDALDPLHYPSPYYVVATPATPLRLEQLPMHIAELVGTIRLPIKRFPDLSEIDLMQLT